ncbi:carbohydrate-binding family 9-like protein [Dasania sp. GY-MA-18]|uniref:Carbohydrate-binding family 9-like protein n=1 Tax=Dasania phycosphaerae TaxID=2950436 RepID=A0A9J6RSK0_9GAMM|nr:MULTISPECIES: carbohydrate-binding family 9-like protein [Dasania]MCR8924386.1 carbohydrate-binding family 9-like protein [Dasania sp. GY-MA-18]MCZ0867061.1 carbohydrate-binding family 9-like protein [Dasania phycosphaerae]MCZ0870513.1 carbohydrate-binding family 9-like protein [Dasania phycosphaerae]
MSHYNVKYTALAPALKADWQDPLWQLAATIPIAQFREESSSHRPITEAKLLYSDDGIHGIFQVQDRYVRCVQQNFQDLVCKDSCVEIYFHPKSDRGYLNFEISGNGTLLSYYITNAERAPGGFKEFVKITEQQGQQVAIISSLPKVVEPEISEATTWTLQFFVPFSLLTHYVGELGSIKGQQWRCNLFKCGDETSHPHWASWQPVPELNFHMPETFGHIVFD